MAWRVAKSILTLHAQLRPLAPNAPASSWGTIGDTAHTSTSDHSPHDFPGWGSQIVTAGDFPRAGNLNPRAVLEAIRQSRDGRLKYAISQGQMFSSYATGSRRAWEWGPYSGSDGHYDHGHLSVVGDARADQTHPWRIGATTTQSTPTQGGGTVATLDFGGFGKPTTDYAKGRADMPGVMLADLASQEQTENGPYGPGPSLRTQRLQRIEQNAKDILAELRNRPVVDASAVAAALAGSPAFVDTLAAAVASRVNQSGGATVDDVREIVDEELDQHARAAADDDQAGK